MTNIFKCLLITLLVSFIKNETVQCQVIKWQKCLGGTAEDKANDVLINPDGTFIVVGYTYSNDGDVSGSHGGGDAWIVKLDTAGNIIWQKSVGGTGYDYFNTVIATSDNAYLCVGYTNSTDGDVSGNHGAGDAWIVKINASGNILWSKCYGGSKYDIASDALLADDGGFAIMGTSWSYDGDVLSGANGRPDSDGWAFKINAAGNIMWEKCLNFIFSFLKPSHLHNDIGYSIMRSENGNYYYALASGSEDYQAGNWPYYDTLITTPGKLYLLDKNSGSSTLLGSMRGDSSFSMCKTASGESFSFVEESYFYPEYCFNESLIVASKEDMQPVSFNRQIMAWTTFCTSYPVEVTKFAGTHGLAKTESSIIGAGDRSTMYHPESGDGYLRELSSTAFYYPGYGGTQKDLFSSVKVFPGVNDYIVVGSTSSNDGHVSGYHGGNFGGPSDCWVVRMEGFNRVVGNVFIDLNNNNIKDAGEPPFNHAIAKTTKAGFQLNGIPYNGFYSNTVDTGTFTTTLAINNPYYTVTPASKISTFTTYKNTDSANFALHPIPGIIDYSVTGVSLLPVRPGFPLQYKIVYTNKGTTTLTNKEVRFIKDYRSQFWNTTPPYTSISGDTLRWNIASLDPEGTGNIILNLVLDPIPIVSLNDTIEAQIYLDSTADIFPVDNSVSIRQSIFGSYDPNDKQENLGGFITPAELSAEKWLNYTIRFQNTGNDTAFNIIIRDTLDTKLQWDSIEMVTSSHQYQANIKDSKYVKWTFNNVKLVDSIHNEPLSHGYISYRIKPKSTLVLGDTIRNRASIYFDFNPAVQTNTQLTIVRTRPVPVLWTGAVSTAWEDPLNWSNGKVPDDNTDVTINTGLPRYPVVNSNANCRSLNAKPTTTVLVKTGYTLKVIY